MMSGLDTGTDAVVFIGYHGKAGTPRSVMAQAISGAVIADVRCDGRSLGELGLNEACDRIEHAVPVDHYIVTWAFSGNVDTSFGGSNPSNFIISSTGGGLGLGLSNVVASSGSGSTEVTDAGGTDRLNVVAAGQWTITIKSA